MREGDEDLAVDEYGRLLCPICPPDEPDVDRRLQVTWTTGLDLHRDFLDDPAAVAVENSDGRIWKIECGAGHVIAAPGGDDVANEETDVIRPRDWTNLRRVLSAVSAYEPEEPG